MAIIRLRDVSVNFGGPALLNRVNLQIDKAERVCLVGRNGVGKSTLLRLIHGQIAPDSGLIEQQQGLVISMLSQEAPLSHQSTVYQIVAEGLGRTGKLLRHYQDMSSRVSDQNTPELVEQLERIQHELEATGAWQSSKRVEAILSRLDLSPDSEYVTLSGGLKRRVLIARALVSDPDLLLLDEPTNHLDIEGIAWLEEFLGSFTGALLFITHDRTFLQRLATRIVDIDRGQVRSYPGDYALYLTRKQADLEMEFARETEFDKQLAREETWIRQGIKARRTRNEGRVRALQKMRNERRERRLKVGEARLGMNTAELSGRLVIEANKLAYDYGGEPYVRDFSTTILRGDKIGIIGPNGCGKTTLLKLLLGKLEPQRGTVRHGARLEIAYFDQHRRQLDESKSVQENVGEGRDQVIFNGKSRHIMGYLQDFLFTPERVRTAVRLLSGGERNRLLLARLFLKPCNVLVMDEPTNDLDLETMELLEELLINYQGTLLLVSHDRSFINNVVTSTLVFEDRGKINEYVGGYDDWLRQRTLKSPSCREQKAATPPPTRSRNRVTKLSYKEKRELQSLPQRIEQLEAEQQSLHDAMTTPDFYRQGEKTITSAKCKLQELEQALTAAYERWEQLEANQQ
jgi:ATP-binding cassette subfamily F protein uup